MTEMMGLSSRRWGVLVLVGSSLVTTAAWGAVPKEPKTALDQKAFFRPDLYISSSHVLLKDALAELPNRSAWERFLSARGESLADPSTPIHIDPRSGTVSNIIAPFPLIPGNGTGNQITLQGLGARLGGAIARVDDQVVAKAVRGFIEAHQDVLGIDTGQLGEVRAAAVTPDLWQVSIPQATRAFRCGTARLAATISHGNLVVIGTETWGNVRGSGHEPQAERPRRRWRRASSYAGGRAGEDEILASHGSRSFRSRRRSTSRAKRSPARSAPATGTGWPGSSPSSARPTTAQWEVIVDGHDGRGARLRGSQPVCEAARSQAGSIR